MNRHVLRYEAVTTVHASTDCIIRTICDVTRIHEWNPALTPIRDADAVAVLGKRYAVRIRGVVPAHLVFEQIDSTTITYSLRALGSVERGTWEAINLGNGRAQVSHQFTHHGLILQAARNAFAPVAEWRVGRLRLLFAHA